MNKKIFGITLLVSALFAGNAIAQNTASKQSDEVCPKGQVCGKNSKCNPAAYCPFEGLNLTDQQKSQIKALKEADKTKCNKAKADKKEQRKAACEAAKEARKDRLAKIKAILTPEQYIQFLENSYVNPGPQSKMGRPGKDGKRHHEGKRGGRGGNRPAPQMQSAN